MENFDAMWNLLMLQLHEALNVNLHNLFSPESICSLLWMFSAYDEFQMKFLNNLTTKNNKKQNGNHDVFNCSTTECITSIKYLAHLTKCGCIQYLYYFNYYKFLKVL